MRKARGVTGWQKWCFKTSPLKHLNKRSRRGHTFGHWDELFSSIAMETRQMSSKKRQYQAFNKLRSANLSGTCVCMFDLWMVKGKSSRTKVYSRLVDSSLLSYGAGTVLAVFKSGFLCTDKQAQVKKRAHRRVSDSHITITSKAASCSGSREIELYRDNLSVRKKSQGCTRTCSLCIECMHWETLVKNLLW